MRRALASAGVLACLLIFASAAAAATSCPSASKDDGTLGTCTPIAPQPFGAVRLARTLSITTPAGIPAQDRSNNNPCVCGEALRLEGFKGLIAKGNQSSWIDPTGKAMLASAHAAGLAIGVYDFDATYTDSEAQTLIDAAETDGLTPTGSNEFPLIFDVEYGPFTLRALEAQIVYVEAHGWRVEIYTGEWWWTPHAGSAWPVNVPAFLSGYPNVTPVTGLPPLLFVMHQWTDEPEDQDVFLGTVEAFDKFVNVAAPKPSPPTPAPAPKPKPKPAKVICWGKGATPTSSACKSHIEHHVWLVDRRNHWQHQRVIHKCLRTPRARLERNIRGCGTDLHWYALRRGQAVKLERKYSA